jgi:hypothetical protein
MDNHGRSESDKSACNISDIVRMSLVSELEITVSVAARVGRIAVIVGGFLP